MLAEYVCIWLVSLASRTKQHCISNLQHKNETNCIVKKGKFVTQIYRLNCWTFPVQIFPNVYIMSIFQIVSTINFFLRVYFIL